MKTKCRPWSTWLLSLLLAVGLLPTNLAGSASAADAKTLVSQVQIRRTQYGVPHIQGETFEAAAFGFGYCQAEDHLLDIMRGVLGVRGELSLHFGPDDNKSLSENRGEGDSPILLRDHPADGARRKIGTVPVDARIGTKNVEADFFNRQFRVYSRAVASYHKLDPDYRAMVEGFVAGLNYYVERHRAKLPPWIPTVTGHDVAAYGVAGVMRFAFNRDSLLKNFLKTQGVATASLDAALDETLDEGEIGSNMWALAPSRSQSGRALLMGNPHQPWAPVSTYYEAHMIVPGKLNFYGSTFIGRPILTSGWNENLGWSHTVNGPDLEEIYELELDPARPDHYLFDGGSVPLERDEVAITIKGESPQTRTFWHTPLGPVVHRNAGKVFVLRSACYENHQAYEQWLRMTQTRNLAEFRRAIEMNRVPMFNICYADRVGNIFYIWNGTVPNLPHPAHKAQAVPASRSSEIWTTFHTTAELPQLLNPPGGYVQNCNSPPYLTNLLAPLDPARYPPHFSPNDLSLRTQHSLRLVHNDKRFTLEELCDLKHSPLMLLAERVKGDLIAALRASGPTSELEAAIKVLENWDHTVAADSRGGTLFVNWWERYSEKDKRPNKYATAWSAAEPTATPRGLADASRAVATFIEALEEVNRLYGRPDVSWGESHRLRKGGVDLPVSGGPGTMGCFRVLDYRTAADGKRVANTGDSWVFAVEFSQPPKAYTVVAYSQSDAEGSPHFSDQAALFSANKMKRAAFTEDEIKSQLLKTYRPGEE